MTWWVTDGRGRLTAWLTVRPGSPPLGHEAWSGQLALTASEPGAWAAVSWIPLAGLGPEIAERLRDPIGTPRAGLHSVAFAADGRALEGSADGGLYDDCLAAAVASVAERMCDASTAAQPRTAGIMVLRLRSEPDARTLELAPATDEPGWRGRPIGIDLSGLGPGAAEPTFGTVTAALGGREAMLPCAHLRFAGPPPSEDASIRITLPTLWVPGAPEPVIHMSLQPRPGASG